MSRISSKKIYSLTLLIILCIAIFLRLYQLGINPPSLNWDETSIGYNAYSVLKTGKDEYGNFLPLSFRSFDDYKPPLYIYLTVPSVAVFGLNPFAVRLPAAIIGIMAVAMMYYFVKEVFDYANIAFREHVALLSAFFLALSPWHLQFSRAAYEGNIGMFFLFSSLLFFLRALKKPKNYIFFGIFFVLSVYSYHSFRLINPILLGVLLIFFRRQILKQKLLFFVSFSIILIFTHSMYTSFLYPQGAAGARLSMVTVFADPVKQKEAAVKVSLAKENKDYIGQVIYNRRFIFLPDIIDNYFDHFGFGYLFLHGDGGVQHHAFNMGMLYIWDVPFLVIGLMYLLRKPNKKTILLFSTFLIAALPASITTGTPHPVRAIAMMPGFHIFTSIGVVIISTFILKSNKKLGYIFMSLISFGLFINIIYYLHQYYIETPKVYGYFWQYGNKEAVVYAKKHEDKYKKITISYKYDQPYIYYLFYNKIDPAWYQSKWDYSKTGEVDRFYRKIGKYEFKMIDYPVDSLDKNVLIFASPSEIPENIDSDHIIYFPDGRVAYKIISL